MEGDLGEPLWHPQVGKRNRPLPTGVTLFQALLRSNLI